VQRFHAAAVSGCPLDPLARHLAESESLERLDARIAALIAAVGGGGADVGPTVLGAGLRRLRLVPLVLFGEAH
jgi:hypothetical protein